MKIAIVSDTHDNLTNLRKIISWLNENNFQFILHCGDVCTQATLYEMNKMFKGEIKAARGNMEIDLDHLPLVQEVKIDNKRIAFVHYYAKALQLVKDHDLVFYGHTHEPWGETIGECRVVNPGTAAGMFNKATFAIYNTETDKLELKILEKL
jgi:hypothetical protein